MECKLRLSRAPAESTVPIHDSPHPLAPSIPTFYELLVCQGFFYCFVKPDLAQSICYWSVSFLLFNSQIKKEDEFPGANSPIKKEDEFPGDNSPATFFDSLVNGDINKQNDKSSVLKCSESKLNMCSFENVNSTVIKLSILYTLKIIQNYFILQMCGGKVTSDNFKTENIDDIESILPTTSICKKSPSDSVTSHEIGIDHTLNDESTLQLGPENVIQFEN